MGEFQQVYILICRNVGRSEAVEQDRMLPVQLLRDILFLPREVVGFFCFVFFVWHRVFNGAEGWLGVGDVGSRDRVGCFWQKNT